jgi:hypothetical protein
MRRPMTLGELISTLSRKDETLPVRFDFVYFQPSGEVDRYRGYYEQLALGYETKRENITVKELLAVLREAVGKTFTGYKGGDYTMDNSAPIWVARWGEAGDTYVADVRDDGWRITLVTECVP